MSGNADRIGSNISVWSRWWCLELSEVKVEWTTCISQKRWSLSETLWEKICVCLPIFCATSLPNLSRFLTNNAWFSLKPEFFYTFYTYTNMKTGSWVSHEAQTSKDSSLIFQTPVFKFRKSYLATKICRSHFSLSPFW